MFGLIGDRRSGIQFWEFGDELARFDPFDAIAVGVETIDLSLELVEQRFGFVVVNDGERLARVEFLESLVDRRVAIDRWDVPDVESCHAMDDRIRSHILLWPNRFGRTGRGVRRGCSNMFGVMCLEPLPEPVRMAQATLAVTLPERVWVSEVSTAHPEATIRVLAAVPGHESGFALVRITAPDVQSVVEDMHDHDQITELTLAQWSENEATVHFETTAPLLMFSSRESGMPIELPVDIQNGEASIEVTGSRERLSDLAEQFQRFGLTYRVEHVRERVHESQLLSDRQRELVLEAVEQGYYDTPRRCSLTELAECLDIAKSTCSETLHRAEETIVKGFVEDLPGFDDTEPLEAQLAGE